MPYFGNKSQTVTPTTSMELCPSDRLVTQLDNWYDGDHTFNVVEILENQDPNITMDTVSNVLFHHTEGDTQYIQGIEELEKLGTVLHCNKEWTQGQYFDYWLFDYKTRIDDLNIQLNDAHDLKPSFLCLNGRPDVHRYLTLHYLMKNKVFDKGYVSFLNRYGQITNKTNWDNFMNIVGGETTAILKRIFYDQKLLLLDKSDNELARNDRDHAFHLYENTSISLVTETYCDNEKGTFITEKTWKPIANCHIPIYIGGTQILNHLREKGYDTFDDIVDNSYENENDFVIRIQRAIKALEDLINKIEKNKLNNDEIKQRLTNNKKLFLKEKITKRTVNKWIKK